MQNTPKAQLREAKTAGGILLPNGQGRSFACPVCGSKGRLKMVVPAEPGRKQSFVTRPCFECRGQGRIWV